MYRRFGKRCLDLTVTLLCLPALLPIFAIVALVVRLFLGRPVFFSQMRAGKDGKVFVMRKFRSMTDVCDQAGNLLPDGERLTPIGKLLRATSLDELPQLWNVMCGDMSLVGPRPLLTDYLPRYNAHQARRHEVRPGITGWAQVNGRNAIGWEKRLDLDVHYVDHLSAWLDFKIMVLTVLCVFQRQGISQADHATMPEFRGTLATTSEPPASND